MRSTIFDVCRNFEFFSQNPQTADGNVAESLAQRLFKHRLSVLASLDARDLAVDPVGDAEGALRRDTADLLHRIVAGMNQDNFVVRPHRQLVQRYRDRPAWDDLDSQAIAEIDDRLSGLPSADRDDDEEAKRFDLLILRAQLCVLNHEPGFATIAERVREIASALLEQTTIPAAGLPARAPCDADCTPEEAMSDAPRYSLGPDVDLDSEDVRRPDGTRLTEDAARELAEEAIRFGRRGRPAVDPEVGPGGRSPRVTFRVPAQTRRRLEQRARAEGRPVADVVRDAVERYLR